MALTADEILVRMVAQNQQYLDAMRRAQGATSQVDKQLKVLRETMGAKFDVGPAPGLEKLSQQVVSIRKEVRNLQFNTPNLAAQINDIAVTAAGGMQPWLIGLQQGTQLMQAFAGQSSQNIIKGMGTALKTVFSVQSLMIVGLVAASAAVVQLGMAALKSIPDIENFESKLSKLNSALREFDDAVREQKSSTEDLIEKYGQAAGAIRGVLQAIADRKAYESVEKMNDILGTFIDSVGKARSDGLGVTPKMAREASEQFGIDPSDFFVFEELRNKLRLAGEETAVLVGKIRMIAEADGFTAQFAAVEAFRRALEDALPPIDQQSDAQRQLLIDVELLVRELGRAVGITDQATGATEGWAAAMSSVKAEINDILGLLSSIGGVAIDNASKRVEIDALRAGRSLADARREARAYKEELEFDQKSAAASTFVDRIAVAIERGQARYARALDAELDQEREAARERERIARGGSGGGARAVERSDDKILKDVAAMEAETRVLDGLALSLDKYGNAVNAARKEAEILQILQNHGVPVTEEMRKRVQELAGTWLDAADALDEARKRHQDFQSQVASARATMENAFVGLVTGAHSLRDALSSVILKLAEMAASRAFTTLWDGGLGSSTGGFIRHILGFSEGGPTPLGPKNKPVGVVHAGENVWSQADVQRAGGMAVVEAMRRSGGRIRGFSDGGYAPPIPSSAPLSAPSVVRVPEPYVAQLVASDDGQMMARFVRAADARISARAPSIVRQSVGATDKAMRSTKAFGGGL